MQQEGTDWAVINLFLRISKDSEDSEEEVKKG